MPVDLNQIDENFPVAGEDNDSQGFRTNFTTIKEALDELQTLGPGYVGSRGVQGYAGSQGYVGSEGTQGPQGYTGSIGVGYTGSTIIGYTGSASTGGGGYTGSQGEPGSPGGYTGSASTVIGYTGSAGGGGGGYTGSASTELGYTGSIGYTGSSGGGSGISYQTTSFTAAANAQYLIDTTSAAVTLTLPATPSTGDYVTFTAKDLETNTVTVTDGDALSDVYDKAIDGAKYYYDSAWRKIQDGTVRSYGNTSNYYEVAVFDDTSSNVIHRTPVLIDYDNGTVEIPAPTLDVPALRVYGYPGYIGSESAIAAPAIRSNGAAYTPSVSVTSASGVLNIDCGLGNVFYTTLTENITNLNLNNSSNGQTINVLFKQGTGGGFTMNWGTVSNDLRWPDAAYEPALSVTAGQRDMFVATYIDIGGGDAFWYCTLTNDFTSPA